MPQTPAPALRVEEYRARIWDLVHVLRRVETVSIADLAAAPTPVVLAHDVHSPLAVPPFDNSQMDGFAVDSSFAGGAQSGAGPAGGVAELPLMPMVTAGSPPPALEPGYAMPVMTGGRIPAGADCVVPVEETEAGFAHRESVRLRADAQLSPGRFVRTAGSDTAPGALIATAGTVLTPALLGVLASVGLAEVPVLAPVRIALVSTGDEVVAPGQERGPAQIYDANSFAATAALNAAGATVVHVLRVPDDPRLLLDRIAAIRADVDLVVSMGGISKGAKEVLRLAADLEAERAGEQAAGAEPAGAEPAECGELTFASVAMQPGGPQGCGRLAGLPWIAAPGNPVSTLITIEMFIRPALLGIAPGIAPRPHMRARLNAESGEASPVANTQVRRALLCEDGTVTLQGGPSSHLLAAYARADALAIIPVGVDRVEPGEELDVWRIG
ncbi:molybdopterin molybdotransferase MoeA [Brevibacterium sp. 50QC2O2]|jgi:molybdopterin molybdotransferase|uniref:molybdopterin molybdotransferase MoeA n=1 Tax=Brevibacterium TaxID=1696 RepID=UPI00211C1234|nr:MULTISPECIES: gephyrin-like molybdotransferase Glp [unclassified Brevibacterium]MCQ9386192.1 molybdopterin molybdotransferase MoeA [Brevibacterium sp. 68QC2CO]MCQ9388547.1 molybdopterin molybdotransferase MoeA [Brevibacterium sp. 50QC2O2]